MVVCLFIKCIVNCMYQAKYHFKDNIIFNKKNIYFKNHMFRVSPYADIVLFT